MTTQPQPQPQRLAYNLYPGNTYLGRGEWHLTVESVSRRSRTTEVRSLNAYGEPVTERYRNGQRVELITA